MSIDPGACPTVGDYVTALMRALADGHPRSFERMLEVVGERVARIGLDDDAIDAWVVDGRIVVSEPSSAAPDGAGRTDTATVLEILDGTLDVCDAVVSGRIRVHGTADAIERIFLAIEILLDASARDPRLQRLAAVLRADPCRPAARVGTTAEHPRCEHPQRPTSAELALLGRLDLLPDR